MILGIKESCSFSLALRSLVAFTKAMKGPAVGSVFFRVRINSETWLFIMAHRCYKGTILTLGILTQPELSADYIYW